MNEHGEAYLNSKMDTFTRFAADKKYLVTLYSHTGYDVTGYFRWEIIAKTVANAV